MQIRICLKRQINSGSNPLGSSAARQRQAVAVDRAQGRAGWPRTLGKIKPSVLLRKDSITIAQACHFAFEGRQMLDQTRFPSARIQKPPSRRCQVNPRLSEAALGQLEERDKQARVISAIPDFRNFGVPLERERRATE